MRIYEALPSRRRKHHTQTKYYAPSLEYGGSMATVTLMHSLADG